MTDNRVTGTSVNNTSRLGRSWQRITYQQWMEAPSDMWVQMWEVIPGWFTASSPPPPSPRTQRPPPPVSAYVDAFHFESHSHFQTRSSHTHNSCWVLGRTIWPMQNLNG